MCSNICEKNIQKRKLERKKLVLRKNSCKLLKQKTKGIVFESLTAFAAWPKENQVKTNYRLLMLIDTKKKRRNNLVQKLVYGG